MLSNDTLLVGDVLRQHAQNYPEKEAIIFEEKRFTYKTYNERVNKLANGLLNLGLKKGDGFAILLFNCSEYMEAYFAAHKAGFVLVPVNYNLKAQEIKYILNNSEAKVLLTSDDFIDTIAPVLDQFEHIERLILLGTKYFENMVPYDGLLANSSANEPETKLKETDPNVIMYTSGTTGLPKGAVRSHRANVLTFMYCSLEYGFSPEDKIICSGPLYHGGPWGFSHMHLYIGATLVIEKKFDAAKVLKAIEQEKITTAFFVPTMFNMMMQLPEKKLDSFDISSVRVLVAAAAPLHTKTKEWILNYFSDAKLFESYGATELGICTSLRHVDQLKKIRCVGKPVLGYEIALFDDNFNQVPHGEPGVIYTTGPCMCDGYYNNKQATRESSYGKWFSVGDIMKSDEQGYLYVIDRKSDMVISGGVNIYPAEIDNAIMTHPKVVDCAVIGIPNEKWGESLMAVIVLKKGEKCTDEEIIQYCKDNIANYKKPKYVQFVNELPRNPSGKILKRVLRDQYWKHQEQKV